MVVELLIQGSASTMKILRIAGFYVLMTLTQYAKRDWVRGWLAERLAVEWKTVTRAVAELPAGRNPAPMPLQAS
jgi:hypothetical protein